jgi:acid phosphatase family membrane protein YuiD
MSIFRILFYNYILNVTFVSWVSAQLLKTIFTYITTNKIKLERLVGAGGMPSAHSAMVCALSLAVSRKCGFSSVEFAIAFALALIVIYDATGVRRAAGEHAKVLNKLVDDKKQLEEQTNFNDTKELQEFLGHTPIEVLGGALLGILVAMIIPVT